MPRVKIVLKPGFADNLVEVDGHDMTKIVSAVHFDRDARDPVALVSLQLRSDQVELDTDLAEVVALQPAPSTANALDALLAGVDAGELEQAALAKLGGMDGGATSVTEALLSVLREIARD